MEGESAQRWLDRLLDEQHGVVAWWQVRDAGVPRKAIDARIARGTLHRVQRGVFCVGHHALTPKGRLMAAVLALGPYAVLSHRSAAEHLGILAPGRSSLIHVSITTAARRRQRRGLVVHVAPGAPSAVVDGIPTTTVAWTLLDLAATARPNVLAQAIGGAERARLFDLTAIRPLLRTTRPGVRALRAAIAEYDDAPSRSELERLFLALCRDHDLPRPRVNELVEGFDTDFHWPAQRFIVETDGAKYHRGDQAGGRDADRDMAHALAGWQTHRFRWRQVVHQPADTAAVIRRALAERDALRTFSPYMRGEGAQE